MSSENKQIVRKFFNDLWNKGNLAVADEIIATKYVTHDPATPDFGKGPLHADPNGTVRIGGLANRLLVNAEPGTLILLGTVLIVLLRLARRASPRTVLEDHRQ